MPRPRLVRAPRPATAAPKLVNRRNLRVTPLDTRADSLILETGVGKDRQAFKAKIDTCTTVTASGRAELFPEELTQHWNPKLHVRAAGLTKDVIAGLWTRWLSVAAGMGPKLHPEYLLRLSDAAQARARSRGASRVTPRDVRDAAATVAAEGIGKKKPTSPAADTPIHYELLLQDLEALRTSAPSKWGRGDGAWRPRVLVLGEKSGVIARMFKRAGCDVATCDLQECVNPGCANGIGARARPLWVSTGFFGLRRTSVTTWALLTGGLGKAKI